MGLRVTKMDLVFLIQEVKSYFNTLAQSKRIDYTFLHEMDSLFCLGGYGQNGEDINELAFERF